jgi:hypothetical protein
MTHLKSLTIAAFVCLSVIACKKEEPKEEALISIAVRGDLQVQESTTYQYGTHVMDGYKMRTSTLELTKYALRSQTINLDDYIDKYVTVSGHKVDGYPLSGGPDLIEVDYIKVHKN